MAKNGLGRSLYAAYVVIRGRRPGVYDTWKDCKFNVDKFPGASFKGFVSRVEAENAFQDAQREGSMSFREDLSKSAHSTAVATQTSSIRWRDQSITQKSKYYVVFVGIRPGVYDNWSDCRLNYSGVPGGRQKSFKSKEEAERAFADAKAKNEVLEKARKPAAGSTPKVSATRAAPTATLSGGDNQETSMVQEWDEGENVKVKRVRFVRE